MTKYDVQVETMSKCKSQAETFIPGHFNSEKSTFALTFQKRPKYLFGHIGRNAFYFATCDYKKVKHEGYYVPISFFFGRDKTLFELFIIQYSCPSQSKFIQSIIHV